MAKTTTPEGDWYYMSPGDTRRERDEERAAMGRWIEELAPWQWFVTCTLGREVSRGFTVPGLGEARRCLRTLLTLSEARCVVCVFELQRDGVPHLHALLAGCTSINGRAANEFFYHEHGISRWKVYLENGGAAAYIGKYLSKEMIELYVGLEGPWTLDDFKIFTGGTTKKGTPRFNWDTQMGGLRV